MVAPTTTTTLSTPTVLCSSQFSHFKVTVPGRSASQTAIATMIASFTKKIRMRRISFGSLGRVFREHFGKRPFTQPLDRGVGGDAGLRARKPGCGSFRRRSVQRLYFIHRAREIAFVKPGFGARDMGLGRIAVYITADRPHRHQ